jgi:hypothetical protein
MKATVKANSTIRTGTSAEAVAEASSTTRLAACYMDSLATLGVPAIGDGIRCE